MEKSLSQLKNIAQQIRQDVVAMISLAGSGHPASALGLADIFSVLYFHVLKHQPKNPQ